MFGCLLTCRKRFCLRWAGSRVDKALEMGKLFTERAFLPGLVRALAQREGREG